MASPRALILRAPGTNCDQETAHAFRLAGAIANIQHVNLAVETPRILDDHQVLCIPGGFSYGDDISAGRILAGQLSQRLEHAMRSFRDRDTLMLGICNGFQVLLKSGLLHEHSPQAPRATLTWNDHGRYECRWVHLRVEPSQCPLLENLQQLYLPVAHAEGKFVPRDSRTLSQLEEAGQLVLRYATPDGQTDEVPFPLNPNGSVAAVAGMCDPSGRVLGLMPHPERFVERTQHPRWTRESVPEPTDGLRLFQNIVAYFG